MRKKGLCKRLQHSGSTTEGLKVNDKMEFDVMIIARGENLKITNVEGHPGYVHLTIKKRVKDTKKAFFRDMSITLNTYPQTFLCKKYSSK